MKITIHIRDEQGWPIFTVDPVCVEGGDKLRVIQFAQDRAREIEALCKAQRDLTKQAKAAHTVRHPATFMGLWKAALTAQP